MASSGIFKHSVVRLSVMFQTRRDIVGNFWVDALVVFAMDQYVGT